MNTKTILLATLFSVANIGSALFTANQCGFFTDDVAEANTLHNANGNRLSIVNADQIDLECTDELSLISEGHLSLSGLSGVSMYGGQYKLYAIPTFINDVAAAAGGLESSQIYKTPSGELRIVL